MVGCFISWHTNVYYTLLGTKNVAKELKKICLGANKWEGIHWWRELADKRKAVYIHHLLCLYMCDVQVRIQRYTCIGQCGIVMVHPKISRR